MAVVKTVNSLDLVTKINLDLPLNVPTHLLSTYSDFAETLSHLTKHISYTGSTLRFEKDLENAEAELQSKKFQYLHYRIMYDEMQNLIFDYDSLTEEEIDSNEQSNKVLERLSKILPLSGVIGYLKELTKSGPILHFTNDSVDNLAPENDLEFQKELSDILQKRLKQTCIKLFNLYKTDDVEDNIDTQISHLPIKLEKDLENVRGKKRELRKLRITRQWQFAQYEKAMNDVIYLLQELIRKFRMKGPPDLNTKMADYLSLKANALLSKLRLLQMEILTDTYPKEVVSAMKVLSDDLKQTACEKEHHLTQLRSTLDAYLSLGKDYENIVANYVKIKEEVENKKWALNKLDEC